jgi:hypothetical protein
LESALSVHLLLQTFNQGNFLAILVLLLLSLSLLLVEELLVSAQLLLHDSGLECSSLLNFFLFKKLDVLVLKVLVQTALLKLSASTRILLLELLI